MATFKVGDKVRIKASCKVGKRYGGITLNEGMKFDGIAEIDSVNDITITLKNQPFYYRAEMFEKADVTKYKVGDRVKVRADLNYDTKYCMDDGNPEHYYYAFGDMGECIGKVVTIRSTLPSGYKVVESTWSWTDEMFEGLVEEEPIPIPVPAPKKPLPKKPNGKFNIGDRVLCTYNQDGGKVKGKTGKIVGGLDYGNRYPVEFDEPVMRNGKVDGHACLGTNGIEKAKKPFGWFVEEQYLELEIFEEFKEAVDLAFDNPLTGLTHLVNPPVLTSIERTKCVIASSTYPYAVMETDGLFFYADIPVGCTYFETIKVLECAE